jgi:hypothetical protein
LEIPLILVTCTGSSTERIAPLRAKTLLDYGGQRLLGHPARFPETGKHV